MSTVEQVEVLRKYQPYSEYKDSGGEWLGMVPNHWSLVAIKRLSMVMRGASPRPIDDPKYFDDEGEYAWVRIADVTSSETYLEYSTQQLSSLGASLSVKLEPNELFLSIAGTVGKPCITAIKACIHDGFVYFPKLKINPMYLFYLFSAGEAYKGLGKMGTQLNLNTETVGNIKIGLPPESELESIVTFLDYETARIDKLIAQQQRLIELLKEKRQAVISHAVTKGLNPDAPMKDSGVEWLGDVPEHWRVCRLKHVKSSQANSFVDGPFGSNLKSEHFVENGDVYVIESNFATTGELVPSDLKTVTNEHFKTIHRSSTVGGDIIIAKIGARFGSSAILPELNKAAVVSGNSLKLTVNPSIIDVEYANHVFQHLKREGAVDDGANVTAQPALSLGTLNNLCFVVPPLKEQHNILLKIKNETKIYDGLLDKAGLFIKLIQERRTTLISAAVTGKIDLRDWTAPTQEVAE